MPSDTPYIAVPRPNWDPSSMTLEEWMTRELQRNPNYQVPNGYQVEADGTVTRTRPAWAYRNPWIFAAPVAVALGATALGVGAAGAAGTGGSSVGGPAVAPTVTGGKFSTFLKAIGGGRTLADIALGGAGLYLQNRQANNAQNAANEAQRAQNEAAQKAIDLQKEMYQTTRNDLAPYRALGQGASAGLGYFMGIPGYEQGNRGILPPSAQGQPMTPPATPAASGNTAVPRNPSAATASEPMVAMRAPDGSMRAVPQSQVSHYQARGAQVAQ